LRGDGRDGVVAAADEGGATDLAAAEGDDDGEGVAAADAAVDGDEDVLAGGDEGERRQDLVGCALAEVDALFDVSLPRVGAPTPGGLDLLGQACCRHSGSRRTPPDVRRMHGGVQAEVAGDALDELVVALVVHVGQEHRRPAAAGFGLEDGLRDHAGQVDAERPVRLGRASRCALGAGVSLAALDAESGHGGKLAVLP